MSVNQLARIRRSKQTRVRIAKSALPRLVVFRSNLHIYAQIVSHDGNQILVSASTLDKEVRSQMPQGKVGGNSSSSVLVGKKIAERALTKGVSKIAFDRSGYRYHGRVKALAEAAREGGLLF